MSTMPSIYSDELTMALAAGKWWAMVEISFPIAEEPEYGGMWGDLVEAQDTSCPTSLVFGDASEKAQRRSQHSGFSDATRKTTKQSRQKIAQGGPVPARSKQGASVPDWSPHGTPVAAPKDNVGLCQAPPQKLYVETGNLNEKTQQQNFNLESHNHQASRRRPEIRSSLRRGSQLSRKKTSDNAGVDPKGVPVHSGTPQVAPVPDGSPHGTPVAAPKDNVGLCQAPPQKLYVETDKLNEKAQQQNFNVESHNNQASRRRPEIRSSLRRGSQLSRKKTSDHAGVDPKGVPVHSGTPQGAPVPDGSPHGTPVAAPKDNVGLCQAPPQKLYVETDKLNEKAQQQNFNVESHNNQASRRRPEIRSSLRRGSQLSRKKTSDHAGVDPKGVPVHSGTPQGAPVPDGSPHGTPVAAPKVLYVETNNLNEKTQQQNFNLESHNNQASRRRPEIRSSLRRGSQLSRKKTSDNAGVDPKGVPVHSETPQVAPMPDGSPHGTPVAAPKDNVGLCQAPPQKLYVETDKLNEKAQQQNFNVESHNNQASRRRPEIRSSLQRGSQLSRKKTSDNAGVDPKGVPVHSGTPQVAPVPDGSPHGTPVAAPKVLYVGTINLNEKMQQQNFNLESHNHQASRRRPEIRSSLRRGSQLSRKKTSDNAGVDPKGVPVHSGTPQVAPVPDGSPHGTPVAAPKVLYVETINLNEKAQQQNFNLESHNHQASRRRPEIRSSLRRGSQLSRKKTSDNVGLCQAPPQKLCVETNNPNEKTQQLNYNLESHNHQAPQRRQKIQSSLWRGSQLSRKRALVWTSHPHKKSSAWQSALTNSQSKAA
ncbi:hypothetical protein ABG768_000624 [Culter alburnus]|uniref:Uncharacterized protein n=1 Tax=Culter alburnus TaxID=194366 RepID=A0AAW2B728_CULAL